MCKANVHVGGETERNVRFEEFTCTFIITGAYIEKLHQHMLYCQKLKQPLVPSEIN